MWYKFDPHKFAEAMLPPLLRSKVLLALLRAMLTPLKRLLDNFRLFASERDASLHLHLEEEHQPPFHLGFTHEGRHEPDFTVHIPSFLRSEEEEIRRFINLYKPAGRTYKIEYYDYE